MVVVTLRQTDTQGDTRRETHKDRQTETKTGTHTHRQTDRQAGRQTRILTASFLSSSWDMISSSLYSGIFEPRLPILACSSATAFSARTRRYSCGNTCKQQQAKI